MKEADIYPFIKKIRIPGKIYRIENKIMAGIPDMLYITPAGDLRFVENKICSFEGSRGSASMDHWRPSQYEFVCAVSGRPDSSFMLLCESSAGGAIYILDAAQQIILWRSASAYGRMVRPRSQEPREILREFLPKPISFLKFTKAGGIAKPSEEAFTKVFTHIRKDSR